LERQAGDSRGADTRDRPRGNDGTANTLNEQAQRSGGIYDFFCCAALGAE
jgi:hypothetical protein